MYAYAYAYSYSYTYSYAQNFEHTEDVESNVKSGRDKLRRVDWKVDTFHGSSSSAEDASAEANRYIPLQRPPQLQFSPGVNQAPSARKER